jgi:hypothetical protein
MDNNKFPLPLSILSGRLAICRLKKEGQIPKWAGDSKRFLSVTRTEDALSIVCEEGIVPSGVRSEKGWRAIKIEGDLGFSLTGVLVSLLNPLAEAKISVFAISTYNTDYVLVKEGKLREAIEALSGFF